MPSPPLLPAAAAGSARRYSSKNRDASAVRTEYAGITGQRKRYLRGEQQHPHFGRGAAPAARKPRLPRLRAKAGPRKFTSKLTSMQIARDLDG